MVPPLNAHARTNLDIQVEGARCAGAGRAGHFHAQSIVGVADVSRRDRGRTHDEAGGPGYRGRSYQDAAGDIGRADLEVLRT